MAFPTYVQSLAPADNKPVATTVRDYGASDTASLAQQHMLLYDAGSVGGYPVGARIFSATNANPLAVAPVDLDGNRLTVYSVHVGNQIGVTQVTSPFIVQVASTEGGGSTITGSVLASQGGAPWSFVGSSTVQGSVFATVQGSVSGTVVASVSGTVPVSQVTSPWIVQVASIMGGGLTVTGSVGATQLGAPWSFVGSTHVTGSLQATVQGSISGTVVASVVGQPTVTASIAGIPTFQIASGGQSIGYIGSGGQPLGSVVASVAGQVSVIASVTGQLFATTSISGFPTVVASVIGAPTVVASIIGQPTVSASVTGQLFATASIAGAPTVVASIIGQPTVSASVTGQLFTTTSLAGVPTVVASVIGHPTVIASVTGQLFTTASVAGAPTVVASVIGQPTVTVSIAGTPSFVGSVATTPARGQLRFLKIAWEVSSTLSFPFDGVTPRVSSSTAAGLFTVNVAGDVDSRAVHYGMLFCLVSSGEAQGQYAVISGWTTGTSRSLTMTTAWASNLVPASGQEYRILLDTRNADQVILKTELSSATNYINAGFTLFDYGQSLGGVAQAPVGLPDGPSLVANLARSFNVSQVSYWLGRTLTVEPVGALGAKVDVFSVSAGRFSLWAATP